MLNTVLAVVGDSATPSLALLHSEISSRYIFFFTKEHASNSSLMKTYCDNNFPNVEVQIHEMPSISEPTENVKFAMEFMSAMNEEVKCNAGIFLTGGAKQTILPLLVHSKSSSLISLQKNPLRIIHKRGAEIDGIKVKVSLDNILEVRGWRYQSSKLIQGENTPISEVDVSFDDGRGELSFVCQSFLKQQGREGEIHQLGKKEKKNVDGVDSNIAGKLIQLSESFGRNGARYIIEGKLRNPTRSVLPSFVRHDGIAEEELEVRDS